MHITFVKKVLSSGVLCPQCEAVFKQLVADGLIDKINHVTIADVRDKQSPGMLLAETHKVKRVPFFLIEDRIENQTDPIKSHTNITVFDVYSEFKQFLN